jgi:hypothetical protein
MYAISLILICLFYKVNGKFIFPSLKINIKGVAASAIAATAFQLPFSPSLPLPAIPAATAAVNPLADVGLKEFLVKDGRQFLRLALPVGKF